MPGPLMPPALGQITPTEARGGPDTTSPGVTSPRLMPAVEPPAPPQLSPLEDARKKLDDAQQRYDALMNVSRDSLIETKLRAMPAPPGINRAALGYSDDERRAASATVDREIMAARQAASQARTRYNDVKREADKEGAVYQYQTTDQNGEPVTLNLTASQYLVQQARDAKAQQTQGNGLQQARLDETTRHNQATEQRQAQQNDINNQLRMAQIQIAKDTQKMQAEGKSADQVRQWASMQLAAVNQWYDNWTTYNTKQFLRPLEQMKTLANQQWGKAVDFTASQNLNDWRYYNTDANNARSQRNKDQDLYVDLIKKLLDVHENRMKKVMSPDQVEKEMSSLRRFAGGRVAKAQGRSKGGIVAAGSQDPTGHSFTGQGQGPSDDWEMPDESGQDRYTAAGYQAIRMPNDPVAWAAAQARRHVLETGRDYWTGPENAQRLPGRGLPGTPDFLYQYPHEMGIDMGAPPMAQETMAQAGIDPQFAAMIQAGAAQYYQPPQRQAEPALPESGLAPMPAAISVIDPYRDDEEDDY